MTTGAIRAGSTDFAIPVVNVASGAHTETMISVAMAKQLRDAGMAWVPASGDRFIVTAPDMEDDIFYLADMMADLHQFGTDTVLGFNGTTEWALDSVEIDQVLWLPREDQLRDALGDAFAGLQRDAEGYVVTLTDSGRVAGSTFRSPDAEDAYGAALVALLGAR